MMIGLLSDFGFRDTYVGAMKAAILNLNPQALLVDFCHHIAPFNILSAAYLCYSAIESTPRESVILCVVDPEVGSKREILVLRYKSRWLIAPDNGIVSLCRRMSSSTKLYKLNTQALLQLLAIEQASHTFHGRDLMAPLAALLDKNSGTDCLTEYPFSPTKLFGVNVRELESAKGIKGSIMHFDHFGNAICSIHKKDIKLAPKRIVLSSLIFQEINDYFCQQPPGTELLYWGSSGFLEIGVNQGDACNQLGLSQGDNIEIHY